MPDVASFVLVILLPVGIILLAIKTVKAAFKIAAAVAVVAILYYLVAPYLDQIL